MKKKVRYLPDKNISEYSMLGTYLKSNNLTN
ncbi:hypothetical protein GALL_193950 [mine drainage metagenome]|uniref:Uncharacterized protein n=1 Tax=mine drainage metagenome TaxID=410659 RepID=A0A1J5RSC0_9ZZZZ